jgi:nitroreductase
MYILFELYTVLQYFVSAVGLEFSGIVKRPVHRNYRGYTMEYEQLLELVKKRRSIRRFMPDPVPDELIDKIIEVARWAPSGFNMQPWEYVVVTDATLREKIVSWITPYWAESVEMEKAREEWQGQKWKLTGLQSADQDYRVAPVFIILYGDPRTRDGLPMGVRCTPHRTNIIHLSGLANTFLYMHLAATSLGLASQWISAIQTPLASCMTRDLLGIPNQFEVFDMVALGYPAIKARGKLMRELDKMVHYNRCGEEDFRTDEEVRDFVRKARNWNVGVHSRKADE